MSLVTSCPQCGTTFRITQEQLTASQGKVRCGSCRQIFDALSRLGEVPTEVPQPSNPSPPPASPDSPALQSPKLVPDTASKAKLESLPARRKIPHWLLAMLALILLLVALLQMLYYLRTPLAAQWPVLRPYLVAACEKLRCTVGLPQHAEMLAIDDSDMQEDAERAGVIHLSATLVNNAPFNQAYPLLELTLTDAYDKPVVRRALTASEYLPGQDVSQGLAPGESAQIRMTLTVGDVEVAGYRLFVTYAVSNENH